ncbi:MAG: hypothetical protein V4654_09755 [Bdellovibrionota bacterium]
MKNAKNYLALYENWENSNAEELWRIWKSVLKCISLVAYSFHAIVKLAIRLLLNSNYLVKHYEVGELPEEICSNYHTNNQNWYIN